METAAMPRSPCCSLPSARALPSRLYLRPRRALAALSAPAARPVVARCAAAAGHGGEGEMPIEKRFPPFPAVMDINQIRDILPHRPIMPGVLMVEAMAQVGGLVMLQPEVGGSRENFFFAGIDKVRFRKPVIAGDTLIMRMTLIKLQKRFGIAKMEGKAYVGSDLVCEGQGQMLHYCIGIGIQKNSMMNSTNSASYSGAELAVVATIGLLTVYLPASSTHVSDPWSTSSVLFFICPRITTVYFCVSCLLPNTSLSGETLALAGASPTLVTALVNVLTAGAVAPGSKNAMNDGVAPAQSTAEDGDCATVLICAAV
uniref:Beta-hydroxyacyl-ACP dehydratase n=1 Tax=Oryza meridionalis TaxID=40149 RepID=A0A0E0DRU5_9ORYZ